MPFSLGVRYSLWQNINSRIEIFSAKFNGRERLDKGQPEKILKDLETRTLMIKRKKAENLLNLKYYSKQYF